MNIVVSLIVLLPGAAKYLLNSAAKRGDPGRTNILLKHPGEKKFFT
ncbi:MAG: hypothetical protein ABIN67_22685 [Ferruginibacter sp.]